MNTKNILKSLAFAMLMPTMLLTTACSSDDDFINNNENTAKKGYRIPVTVNVTRQGDATTRAAFDSETKKLGFSEGDKLYVEGWTDDYEFAAILEWTSGGSFTGELITDDEYDGTPDALFTEANDDGGINATLLPSGYENYGFLTIDYTIMPPLPLLTEPNYANAIAGDLATAIEQFSLEETEEYNGGFTLAPSNAIFNCSFLSDHGSAIAGESCKPFLKDVDHYDMDDRKFGGEKTFLFDENGVINFAIAVNPMYLYKVGGVPRYYDFRGEVQWLLDDDNNYTYTDLGNRELIAGKIYNYRNYKSVADALKDGKTTVIAFNDGNLTLSATYNGSEFGDVTKGGINSGMVTAASMEKDGDNLVITVTVMGNEGSMTINTANNTYTWSDAEVGAMITLSDITIDGNSIDVLPSPAAPAAPVASSLADAFVNGNETVIAFNDGNLTLSATYDGSEFGDVTKGGINSGMVTAASMAKDGDNLVITVTVMGNEGSMTINTANNTYTWSDETIGSYITLSAITIGDNIITPLPTPPAQLLSVTVDGNGYIDGVKTIYYVAGETWGQAIANHPTENAGWYLIGDQFASFEGAEEESSVCDADDEGNYAVKNSVIDANHSYYFDF